MAGVGPAPKFETRRRNPAVGMVRLPAGGRKGKSPGWPLEKAPTEAEKRIWAELWHTPQAVAWETLGWTRMVARYARCALAAENLDKDAMAEARQLEDRLGLSPKAMRMLLWVIEPEEDTKEAPLTPMSDRWREAAAS